MTLLEFLRARLDEDAATAQANADSCQSGFLVKRMMALVESDQRVIDECAVWCEELDRLTESPGPVASVRAEAYHLADRYEVAMSVLRAMADRHKDHPEYQQKWRSS